MGLKTILRRERKEDLASIITLSDTDKSKAKINSKSIAQKQQLRKKYLN